MRKLDETLRSLVALGLLLLARPGLSPRSARAISTGAPWTLKAASCPGSRSRCPATLGTRTTVTSSQGEFPLPQPRPGRYTITLSLAGFGNTVREVVVTTGENVNLDFTLKVASVQETVEVMGETPLVDVKKRGTSTTMINGRAAEDADARDPWGVLKNVPGVQVDRIEHRGQRERPAGERGRQGHVEADKMWSIDGLVVTGLTATGARPPTSISTPSRRSRSLPAAPTSRPSPAASDQHGDQARHQQVPGGRPVLLHPRRPAVEQPARRAARRLAAAELRRLLPRQADHNPADRRLRLRPRRPIFKDKLWFYGSWASRTSASCA